MASKKTRIKAPAIEVPVPQNRDEVARMIALIGEHQREREIISTAMNDELAKLKEAFEAQAKPHADQITALSKGVHTWCEANRAVLTQDGKVKFSKFATGEVKWRMRPKSIALRGIDSILELLKARGLERFIRKKEEVDKDAMLRETDVAAGIPGVSVSQKEDFVVVPFETNLEEVQS